MRWRRGVLAAAVLVAAVAAVAGGVAAGTGGAVPSVARRAPVSARTARLPAPAPCPGCWRPPVRTSWDWVLAEPPVPPFRDVDMYDVDGQETPAGTVAALHRRHIRATCYVDAGGWERYRPDAADFPTRLLGRPLDGWPGERWLDVRDLQRPHSVLRAVLDERLDGCRTKGFDAVELDNVDGYANRSGFPITAGDQLFFDATLADDAHRRGMSVLQKNDGAQTPRLLRYFDGALDEQCNQYRECQAFAAYVRAGKPVFQAEYTLPPKRFCAADNARDLNGVRFDLDLDDRVFGACRP